jgi:hypothetical protein
MTMYLQFKEVACNSFKTLAEEGIGAHCGTRFRIKFQLPSPDGTRIFVTTSNITGSNIRPKAVLVQPLPQLGTVEGVPVAELKHITTGTVVEWEWIDGTPPSAALLEEVVFGVVIATAEGAGSHGVEVTGCLSPICTHNLYPDTIPQFVNLARTLKAISFVD